MEVIAVIGISKGKSCIYRKKVKAKLVLRFSKVGKYGVKEGD